MRADNDHVVGNSVESCKDESKPQNCLEEKWEDAELKILENGKNDNNVCELFYDTRTGEELDKDNDGNHSCEAGKKLGVDSIDAKNGSLETVDPVFFMDKNVTACDLPEIVVCYKENAYHVVKDICVDEGVPIQEKFLFGEKGSVKCSSDSKQCESEDLMKADNEIETTKSSEDRNGMVDDGKLCNDPKTNKDVEESPREDFADAEGSSSCNQDLLIVAREAMDSLTPEISHEIEVATLENHVPKECKTLGDILSWEDEPTPLINHNNNIDRREEQSPPQLQEKERHEPEKAEDKLSSVSTTTSQEPTKTFKDPGRPETDNQQPNLLVGDSFEDNKLISSGFGETSFSAAEAVSISGHITYTGPIAFSGSLSVRSDASTTSGRSFAFPVLQSEWNSSPVRMAKPEKRRHKGWRQILPCCRSS